MHKLRKSLSFYHFQLNTAIHEQDDGLGGNKELLNTIKLPKNLKLLSDRLPKSKYYHESHEASK